MSPAPDAAVDPATARPVKLAWIAALVWGSYAVAMATVSPLFGLTELEQSAGVGLLGLLVISLGLAVKQGDRFAAWSLVAVPTFELTSRIWLGVLLGPGALLPVLVLVIFTRGAIYLQRHTSTVFNKETWVRVLYQLAFLQATWTAVVVIWSLVVSPLKLQLFLGRHINIMYVTDVGILVGFGFAAYKRQVWAGYALVLYQLVNVHSMTLRPMPGMDLLIPLGFALIYGIGAFHLHQMHGPMTRWGRVTVVAIAALAIAVSVSSRVSRPTAYQRISQEYEQRLMAIPGFKQRIATNDPVASVSEVIRNGLVRLGNNKLMDWVQLVGMILEASDEDTCAEMFRRGGVSVSVLAKLSEESLRAWYDLVIAAAAAELQSTTPVIAIPSEQVVDSALETALSTLPQEEKQRMARVFAMGGKADDADTCWAYRTLIRTVPHVERSQQQILARWLAAQ